MKKSLLAHQTPIAALPWEMLLVVLVTLIVLATWFQRSPPEPVIDAVREAASSGAGAGRAEQSFPAQPLEGAAVDADYVPMVTVAPVYPAEAERQRIEGRCAVEYTIAATGAVRDVRARRCEPRGVFEKSAVNAARQFKYRPRIQAGAPVEVQGVRNEFRFSLQQ